MKNMSNFFIIALVAVIGLATMGCPNDVDPSEPPSAAAPVPVTDVTLNKSATTIAVGASETLAPTVVPVNATNKTVSWTTSDASKATVANGVVTGVAAGTATITVTTEDGGFEDECVVTVKALSSITITAEPNKTVYGIGETLDITGLIVTATFDDSSTEGVTITIANITGFDSTTEGQKTLTVTYGGKTATFNVTVNSIPPLDLTGDITIDEPAAFTAGTQLTAAYSGSEVVTYQWKRNGVEINGATGSTYTTDKAGSYTVTVSAEGYNNKTSVAVIINQALYIITGSGTTFTATRNGVTIGTANQLISNVIEAIKTSAGDNQGCIIQFGENGETVDLGTSSNVQFYNSNNSVWGLITLTGKITSALSSTTSGTIRTSWEVSINSTADITNTADNNGNVFYHGSTGTLTISGGTVSTTTGSAVYNYSEGSQSRPVIISGGTVSATTGYAVYNTGNGGSVTISGTATVTSANTATGGGTVYNAGTGSVIINGGTVENVGTGNAVYNSSIGDITLGGDPVIGVIGQSSASTGLILSSNPQFAPSLGKKYTLYFDPYSNGAIAVEGGANFLTNFQLTNTYYNLEVVDSDLKVIDPNIIIVPAGTQYIITGSGTSFSAMRGNETAASDQPIQTVIDTILNEAPQVDISIQFGDGGVLDIGASYVLFSGGWGLITLTGKITSSYTNVDFGVITTDGRVSLVSTADITANNGYGTSFYHKSTDTLTINGGTISTAAASAQSRAVINASTGTLMINGGTISVTAGTAVISEKGGTLTISGGTVSATTGSAVRAGASDSSYQYGAIAATITGDAFITSANTTANRGTIQMWGASLVINGGTVENTVSGNYALYPVNDTFIYLGNDPTITGVIGPARKYTSGMGTSFAPSVGKVYMLGYSSVPSVGSTAVNGGAAFESYFELYNQPTRKLVISGNDLVIAANP